MLVDILLATYNGEKYIDALLASLSQQSFTDWRLIVRDDNSTDATIQRIEWFKKYINPNVVILPTESRAGIKGNFSLLMEYSTAPYVMLCDQDDVWLPRKIAVSLDAIQKMDASKPALVHTDLIVVDNNLDTLADSFLEYSGLEGRYSSDFKSMLIQNVVTGCTVIMNRKLVELATPIPNSAIMHDWWIALVSTALGNTVYLPDSTILYRQHGNNDTGATPFNAATVIRKMLNLKDIHQRIVATQMQAAVLLARYVHQLSETDSVLLREYSELNKLSRIQRRFAIHRLGIDTHSIARNIGLYLCL